MPTPILLLRPVAAAAAVSLSLLKAASAARQPSAGERIEFLSDALTDKGPATGEIIGVKVTVDGLYVTVKFPGGQESFSWDDLEAAGADVRGDLWMVKSHPALFPGPRSRAQAEAGNYLKRRISWQGLTLVVENEPGTVRQGNGWETRMLFAYGEVEDSLGVDGDRVDVYIGPALETAPFVYVVHQNRYGRWSEYDEDKCMLGFLSEEEAALAYLEHYDDPRFLGPITTMPVAEFVVKVLATRDAPAMIKSWLGGEDLLKATVKKTITVPGYYKADGTFVAPHQKAVHYNPGHNLEEIAGGGVSHSQKLAHKKLTEHPDFHKKDVVEKASLVMAHATDLQDAASASAAISGWKAAALSGKNPSAAQWAAFHAAPKEKQAQLYDALVAAGKSFAHLKPTTGLQPFQNVDKAAEEKKAAAPPLSIAQLEDLIANAPVAPPVDESASHIANYKKEADADYAAGNHIGLQALADEAMHGYPAVTEYAQKHLDNLKAKDALEQLPKSGSHYQKEAHKKLAADPAWKTKPPAEQHADVMALYKQLQGAASQSAAVSLWKKQLLAGKYPSGAQVAAFQALAEKDHKKAAAIAADVVKQIGADKFIELTGSKTGAAPAASAPIATHSGFPPAQDVPAHDYVAKNTSSVTSLSPSVLAHHWLEQNPDGAAELSEALTTLGYAQLAANMDLPAPDSDEDGPQEGATKPGANGGTLVLHNGRWVSQDGGPDLPKGWTYTPEDHGFGAHPSITFDGGDFSLYAVADPETKELQVGVMDAADEVTEYKTFSDPAEAADWISVQMSANVDAASDLSAEHLKHLLPKNPEPAAKGAAIDPTQTFFHYGAHNDSSTLQPLTFFTTSEKHAKTYEANGKGQLHAVHLSIKNAASQEDVKAAAEKLNYSAAALGMDDDDVVGFEFLSPHLGQKMATDVMAELKKQGFDGAHLAQDFDLGGGELPGGSYVIFSSDQAKPVASAAPAKKTAQQYAEAAAAAAGISATSVAIKAASEHAAAGNIKGVENLLAVVPKAKAKTKAAVQHILDAAKADQGAPAAAKLPRVASVKPIGDGQAWGHLVPGSLPWADLIDAMKKDGLGLVGAQKAAFDALPQHLKQKAIQESSKFVPNTAPAPVAEPEVKTVTAPKYTYHHTTDGHNKSWSVHVVPKIGDGAQMVTTYGKIGAKQQTTTKDFATSDAAHAAALAMKKEKEAKGYKHHATDYGHKAVLPASKTAPDAQPQGDIPPPPTFSQIQNVTFHNAVLAMSNHASNGNVVAATQEMEKLQGLITIPAQKAYLYGAKAMKAAGMEKPAWVAQADWDGPKDGDTKRGKGGGMLVFKDGYWHKMDEPVAAAPTPIPANAKLSTQNIKDAVAGISGLSNKGQVLLEKAKVAAAAGDLHALKAVKTEALNAGKLAKTSKAISALESALMQKHKTADYVQPVSAVSGNVTMTPAAAPAAAKPAAAPSVASVKPMGAPPAAHKPGEPQSMAGWTKVGEQKGSNPGGSFKDKNGTTWYCKFPKDEAIARSEVLAAKFYQMLGVDVPLLKLVKGPDGKVGIASKWTDGLKQVSASALASTAGAHDGFVFDAWLGNWDVVGMSNDNLMVGPKGAMRVDVGGSLEYRAQGGKKTDFGDTVPELETLLDASKNPKAAAVFKGISKASIDAGLAKLNMMKDSQIEELIEKIGPGSAAEKKKLAATLIARRAFILNKYGVKDQWTSQKQLDPKKLPVNPKDLPAALPVAFFKSSKAWLNEANAKDSAALIAFASQGNLTALKDYYFDAIDKETGAPAGKKPITAHVSSHIQQQWAGLVELLQSIASPSLPTLEMPSLGAVSALEDISDFVGAFKPTDRPETVATEHRLGFFMSLNQIDDIHDLVKDMKWSFIQKGGGWASKMMAAYSSLSALTKKYVSAVQSSGSINHVWSQGKAQGAGVGVHHLAHEIYKNSVDLPEGTVLRRGMSDTTAGKAMMKQLLQAKPGLVIQNTDSMCTSFNEAHSWGGDIQMTIRCPKGCKATPSFATGNYGGEYEITTLPGQRFVVLGVKQKPGGGIDLDVLMLPPHQGYIADLQKLSTLGKALQSVLFFRKAA